MKLRHVRTVAVAAVVVVALTGARHSHGGSCGSGHSSSGSSGGYGSSGSTTSGTTGGSPTAGATTSPDAEVTVTDCKVDSEAGTLRAQIRVHNGNTAATATYNGSVEFTDETGSTFGTAEFPELRVAAGQSRTAPVSGTFITGPDKPRSGTCKTGMLWKLNN